MQLEDLDRHDWPILTSRVMRDSESRPNNHISIFDILMSLSRIGNTSNLILGLESVASSSVELLVLVFGDPDVMLSELRTAGLDAFGLCEEGLGGDGHEFVSDGFLADGVDDA